MTMQLDRALALVFALACGSSSPPALAVQHDEGWQLHPPAFAGLFSGGGADMLLQKRPAAAMQCCQVSPRRRSCALRTLPAQSPRSVPQTAVQDLVSCLRPTSGVSRPARTALAAGADAAPPPAGRSVGIDLGTTNSAVAAIVDGKPVIIR